MNDIIPGQDVAAQAEQLLDRYEIRIRKGLRHGYYAEAVEGDAVTMASGYGSILEDALIDLVRREAGQ